MTTKLLNVIANGAIRQAIYILAGAA